VPDQIEFISSISTVFLSRRLLKNKAIFRNSYIPKREENPSPTRLWQTREVKLDPAKTVQGPNRYQQDM
jgi:hypothetical protein